jgi:opacity protein-like surface antigen
MAVVKICPINSPPYVSPAGATKEAKMAKLTLVSAVVILFASAAVATAAQQGGASTNAPGQEQLEKGGKIGAKKMKQHRSVTKKAPKLAPGREMKKPGY